MHPRSWGELLKLHEATGSIKPLMTTGAGSPTEGVPRSIFGIPVYLTGQLSITETQAI